jgi:hypothetical protein
VESRNLISVPCRTNNALTCVPVLLLATCYQKPVHSEHVSAPLWRECHHMMQRMYPMRILRAVLMVHRFAEQPMLVIMCAPGFSLSPDDGLLKPPSQQTGSASPGRGRRRAGRPASGRRRRFLLPRPAAAPPRCPRRRSPAAGACWSRRQQEAAPRSCRCPPATARSPAEGSGGAMYMQASSLSATDDLGFSTYPARDPVWDRPPYGTSRSNRKRPNQNCPDRTRFD